MDRIDLTIDVTEAAGFGEEATIALTVHLPAPQALGSRPTVCFAKPGGGFTKEYFTADLPGPGTGSQAEWHAERGWVFVSVDHLGVGGSSRRHDPHRLGFRTVTAASHAAERFVLDRLTRGELHESFPPLPEPVVLGIGQSMGGCLTVAQQGRYHRYDGIGVLGYGAVRSQVPVPPGEPPVVRPWILRDSPPGEPPTIVNAAEVAAAQRTLTSAEDAASVNDWLFYYDDVDVSTVRHGPWTATTYPTGVAVSALTPGVIAAEAAAVRVPVLVAMGERDVVADPRGEPRAYLSAPSVDLFVCPRMAHMHNFGGTREVFWQRIETWASWVAACSKTRQLARSK